MHTPDIIRGIAIALGLVNAALCLAYARHLWQQGTLTYAPVFHAATWTYNGLAVLILGLAWRTTSLLGTPLHPAVAILIAGEMLILYGLCNQLRHIAHREW